MAAKDAMDYGIEDLKQNMHALFEQRESGDMTIRCQTVRFQMHSMVICPRSEFFAAAVQSLVGKTMTLRKENPSLVSNMIYCCYHGDYDDTYYAYEGRIGQGKFVSQLQTNVEMYAMLERFGMSGMKKVAKQKVESILEKLPPGGLDLSLEHCALLDIIPFIYSRNPDKHHGLRGRVSAYVARDWHVFKAKDQFKSVIAEYPDFVIDVCDARVSLEASAHKEQLDEKPSKRRRATDT